MTPVLAARGLIRSPAMMSAARDLRRALTMDGGVLLCGDPGTGRAQFARAIHLANDGSYGGSVEQLLRESMEPVRSNGRPFIEVDCTSPNGIERQLFGCDAQPSSLHGLDHITEGSVLHNAFGGTLVLNHVPELPGRLQIRLARVLRDGEVLVQKKDGTERFEAVNLRPIATMDAASGDDHQLVPLLRTRLEQTTIMMPRLRDRREDIPSLVAYLLVDICASLNLPAKTASRQAIQLLTALPWQGNLQELKGLLQVLVLKVPGAVIRQGDVLRNIRLDGGSTAFVYGGSLKEAREQFEREYVAAVLEQHHGRMAEAAKALGIQRTNLYRKVRQLSVKRRVVSGKSLS